VYTRRVIVTSGEPAGIGPDACVLLAQADWPALKVLHIPTAQPVQAGVLNSHNAAYVLAMLDRACDGCMNGEFAAMVTAPVQKSTIMDAGFAFTGHTEYLASRTRAALPVMMLLSGELRVALVTTHLPLAEVPRAITRDRVLATLRIVHHDLERHFDIASPRIAVLGLNPHAGESGHLGNEEIAVIAPAIRDLQREGLNLRGPLPADTAFAPQFLAQADVVVAMYHDQGLPVIKHVGFGNAVNVTLGLPILRTSVDHGTALSLARTGQADVGSLRAALMLAVQLTGGSTHVAST
jgi:4-hydroxythreonine-4-phosphate dehydrogenase